MQGEDATPALSPAPSILLGPEMPIVGAPGLTIDAFWAWASLVTASSLGSPEASRLRSRICRLRSRSCRSARGSFDEQNDQCARN